MDVTPAKTPVRCEVRFDAETSRRDNSTRVTEEWSDAWETAAILVRAAGVNDPKLKAIGRAMSIANLTPVQW